MCPILNVSANVTVSWGFVSDFVKAYVSESSSTALFAGLSIPWYVSVDVEIADIP